jgi:hypothetical protein
MPCVLCRSKSVAAQPLPPEDDEPPGVGDPTLEEIEREKTAIRESWTGDDDLRLDADAYHWEDGC